MVVNELKKEVLGEDISNALPVGTIIENLSELPSDTFIKCDGRVITREEYPKLIDLLSKDETVPFSKVLYPPARFDAQFYKEIELGKMPHFGISPNGKLLAFALPSTATTKGEKVYFSFDGGITWDNTVLSLGSGSTVVANYSNILCKNDCILFISLQQGSASIQNDMATYAVRKKEPPLTGFDITRVLNGYKMAYGKRSRSVKAVVDNTFVIFNTSGVHEAVITSEQTVIKWSDDGINWHGVNPVPGQSGSYSISKPSIFKTKFIFTGAKDSGSTIEDYTLYEFDVATKEIKVLIDDTENLKKMLLTESGSIRNQEYQFIVEDGYYYCFRSNADYARTKDFINYEKLTALRNFTYADNYIGETEEGYVYCGNSESSVSGGKLQTSLISMIMKGSISSNAHWLTLPIPDSSSINSFLFPPSTNAQNGVLETLNFFNLNDKRNLYNILDTYKSYSGADTAYINTNVYVKWR